MRLFSNLRGQFVLVVAAAVIISNGAVVALLETERQGEISGVRMTALLERIAASLDLIGQLPAGQRGRALRAMTTQLVKFHISSAPPAGHVMDDEERGYARTLAAVQTPGLPQPTVHVIRSTDVTGGDPSPTMIEIAQALPNGGSVVARVAHPDAPAFPRDILLGALAAVLLTCAAAAWLAGRVSRPLSSLAAAAGEVARGRDAPRLALQGPADIRQAAQAFNEMSNRVTQTLESHRQLLSAVGHDLRTPIAAMRITAEFVHDADVRARLARNLDELQSLTEAVLSAARSGPGEQMRRVDLAALIQSLCDDLVELHEPVECSVEGPAPCSCRPNDIRRAVRNLIENAVRYGQGARVSLAQEPGAFAIVVEDDGPGIPAERLEQVFEPFVRLESSRSTDTGGAGLGLTLARAIAREHGGDIILENRTPHGLRATFRLPAEKTVAGPVTKRAAAGA